MIDKHVMETIPTNKKVKIADNSVLKIDKMTKKIEVNISGHICFLEFWVIDNQENDALLGLDWFNLTGAGVFPNQNTIKFPSETIILDSDMNDDESSEGILTTEGIHDEYIVEEEWPLDKASDKFECKPEQKLDEEEFEYFKMAVYSMKKIFAMDAKKLGIGNVNTIKIITTDEGPIFIRPYRKVHRESFPAQIRNDFAAAVSARHVFFSNRVVPHWNKLPENVTCFNRLCQKKYGIYFVSIKIDDGLTRGICYPHFKHSLTW
ncbi:hypothetical protein BpHYR1_011024 [Brachionus plicatilis]|uniref:Uncharacterized protein n=1 Tax=Brachionus plicatilis TaxID=10195 RepID=A0A3M7SBU3_BRAPC|nr:hypothetical protein BpHYR1_011024 [Brachionus plicatilis]